MDPSPDKIRTLPSLVLALKGLLPWALYLQLTWLTDVIPFGPSPDATWLGWTLFFVFGMVGLIALGASPWYVWKGARLAWKERDAYGLRARISRWLNVVALACYLGFWTRVLLLLLYEMRVIR